MEGAHILSSCTSIDAMLNISSLDYVIATILLFLKKSLAMMLREQNSYVSSLKITID